jgi:hypothetical protein
MTHRELLAELIQGLARDLRPELEPLTPDELNLIPGAQAKSNSHFQLILSRFLPQTHPIS